MYTVLICWDVLTKHLKNNELIVPGSGGWGVQEQHAAEPQSGEDPFSDWEVVQKKRAPSGLFYNEGINFTHEGSTLTT